MIKQYLYKHYFILNNVIQSAIYRQTQIGLIELVNNKIINTQNVIIISYCKIVIYKHIMWVVGTYVTTGTGL